MIKKVTVKRFKKFESETFTLHETGLTICAGPNSSGKSTLLHALAVWAFGVTVVRQFKGDEALLKGNHGQGAGISTEDFTPINIPDLRHLWLNLKTQLPSEGYSMSITVEWSEKDNTAVMPGLYHSLTMSFSLVQDRLFIKAENSNLDDADAIPSVIYVPPVAGVNAREEFATLPKRKAMLGKGLAGAILRNYLYDLEVASKKEKERLQNEKGGKRLNANELKKFRAADPWERLNEFARERFSFELRIVPFNPDFHTVLKVLVQPKRQKGNKWYNNGVARDLMVEGSGAQQWLTILTFALSPQTDVLLLDEPDAHLFTELKLDLVQILDGISNSNYGPQILLATHAIEILKRHPIDRILNFGGKHPRFLTDDVQRSRLISGLGDDYSPLIEKARNSRALLFVENESDRRILEVIAGTLGLNWPRDIAVMATTDKHSDRLKFYGKLLEAIDGLKAVSIRDRDDLAITQIDQKTLRQKDVNTSSFPDFLPLTWCRREIENYALVPSALKRAVGKQDAKKWWIQQGWDWSNKSIVEEPLRLADVKKSLSKLIRAKGLSNEKLLKSLEKGEIHSDLKTTIQEICSLCN